MPNESEATTAKKCVLIVDDRSEFIISLIQQVAELDFICKIARSYEDFVDAFYRANVRLIVLQTALENDIAIDCLLHVANSNWDGLVLLTDKGDVEQQAKMLELARSLRLSQVKTLPTPVDFDRFQLFLDVASRDIDKK